MRRYLLAQTEFLVGELSAPPYVCGVSFFCDPKKRDPSMSSSGKHVQADEIADCTWMPLEEFVRTQVNT
eukprot:6201877-Pleurochrysis_carterae.AAC.2